MPVSDTHTQTHRHKSSCTRHVHSRICLASKLHPAQIERMYLCWTIQNSTINLTKKKWINTVKWKEKELSIEAGRALCGHRTEETLLWACVSAISFLLLYCMSLFFLPPPPQSGSFVRKGREMRERRVGGGGVLFQGSSPLDWQLAAYGAVRKVCPRSLLRKQIFAWRGERERAKERGRERREKKNIN